MKVRIRSGSQAGAIVEMGRSEAESAFGTWYAEPFVAFEDREGEGERGLMAAKKKAPPARPPKKRKPYY